MRRLSATFALAIAVTAFTLTGCGRDQPPVVGTSTIAVNDREALPPISGTTLDGTSLDVASLRGKVVVLNSWATWCDPCRSEVPTLVKLAASTKPDEVAIVGLDVSDNDDAARQFARDFSMNYPSIIDSEGVLLPTIPGVPPAALPSTVILDREGRIAVRIIGEVDASTLPGLVAQVAAEPSPTT